MKKLISIAILIILLPISGFNIGGENIIHIVDCGKYLKIIDNGPYLYNPGYPLLPYRVKNYIFPVNTVIKNISIRVKNIERIKIHKSILPSPPAFAIGEGKIYEGKNAYDVYPEKWFEYAIRRGIWHGKPSIFLTIYLFPYRYKKGIILHADFDLDVEYTTKSMKENSRYDLLIITPSKFDQEVKKLAEFKESHGIRTKIEHLRDIYSGGKYGDDFPEKIKYAIKDAIEQYGIKYVLLAGDADVIPVRYVNFNIEEANKVPTDLYYADIYKGDGSFSSWDENGNGRYGERSDHPDLMPDVYIGRLPASDENEMRILVNKIMQFSLPPQRAIFVGTELFYETYVREGEYLKDYIASCLPGMKIEKLYEIDGKARSEEIAREINEGALFVNFAAHGSPSGMGWETGGWEISDLKILQNGNRLPIVFAMSCLTGDFDETDCLGEEFLLAAGGGAIAYAGSSRVAYVDTEDAIKNGLSGYLDFAFFKAYYDGFNTTGSIFTGAKEYYLMHFTLMNDLDRLTVMEYNLFGDPTISIPQMPRTSKAYVESPICNGSMDVYSSAYEYNGNASLYYRPKGWREWIYYGSSNTPYHWKFVPPSTGIFELCSIVDGEQFPLFGDCLCIYDNQSPTLEITSPEKGGIYIFNSKIMETSMEFVVAMGKIDIEGRAKDKFFDRVEIAINGKVEYITQDKNFKWEWSGIHFGLYQVEITAYDVAQNTATQKMKVLRLL